MSILNVRPALFEDYPIIDEFDEFLGDRRIDMQRGEVYVCENSDNEAIGYLRISKNHFFDWPIIVNLCVNENYRRRGAGYNLIRYAMKLEFLPRLYISTEKDNTPMNNLLLNIGADEIGYLDKLNFSGERELIYRLK